MLTDEQAQQFQKDGYLVFEALIQGERLAYYKKVFDELLAEGRKLTEGTPRWLLELDADGTPQAGLLYRIEGVCVVDSRVLALAREPAILDRVEALIGANASRVERQRDIDVFGTKFFPKLPNGGTSTYWHQDNYYFGTKTHHIISCGVYLDDSDVENGCLRVVRGSHRMDKIVEHHRDLTTHGSWTEVDESRAVDVIVPAGTVILFSANILHGAYDNHSNRTRYSTAWHYLPEDLNPENFVRGEYEDRHVARKR